MLSLSKYRVSPNSEKTLYTVTDIVTYLRQSSLIFRSHLSFIYISKGRLHGLKKILNYIFNNKHVLASRQMLPAQILRQKQLLVQIHFTIIIH